MSIFATLIWPPLCLPRPWHCVSQLYPDGSLLATGDVMVRFALWRVVDGQQVLTWKGHAGWILTVTFSLTAKLASCSHDPLIRLWDVQTSILSSPTLQTWLKRVIPAISQSPVSTHQAFQSGLTIAYASAGSANRSNAGEWQ